VFLELTMPPPPLPETLLRAIQSVALDSHPNTSEISG
jgi:hypothetical protein